MKITKDKELLSKYKEGMYNTDTNNIFSFFIEKAMKIGNIVSLIVPKSLINAPEFNKTRNLMKSKSITAIPCTSLDELKNFVESILNSEEKAVAFDTETDSLNSHEAGLVGFSLSFEKGRGIYVPVFLGGGMFAPETISQKDCLAVLEKLFSEKELTLAMHNGKFDLEVLAANGMEKRPECKIFDTMVAAWLLNPAASGKSPYSLEYLAETKLGLKGIEFKDIVQKNQTFADVPLEKAFKYGAEDSVRPST